MKRTIQQSLFFLYGILGLCQVVFCQDPTIEIHQIDIGQGDATLINVNSTLNGIQGIKSILIDAGIRGGGPTTISYLSGEGKGELLSPVYLDYVIASHYDADHIGGFVGPMVPQGKRKGGAGSCTDFTGVLSPNSGILFYEVLDQGPLSSMKSDVYEDYEKILVETKPVNGNSRRITIGQTAVSGTSNIFISPPAHQNPPEEPADVDLPLGGYIYLGKDGNDVDIKLRLWAANGRIWMPDAPPGYCKDLLAGQAQNKLKNPNNRGLVWVLEYGTFRYFTGGDIGGSNESSLINIETPLAGQFKLFYTSPSGFAIGHICAFKVNHHGSEYSTDSTFLSILKPTIGVTSSGVNNHGHPTKQVINNLEACKWGFVQKLSNERISNYYFTELYYAINVDLSIGKTSGNRLWVATSPPVPKALQFASEQMPNKSYLYEISKKKTPEVNGDIKILVYPVNISNTSRFTVQWRNYQTGNWEEKLYNCHTK